MHAFLHASQASIDWIIPRIERHVTPSSQTHGSFPLLPRQRPPVETNRSTRHGMPAQTSTELPTSQPASQPAIILESTHTSITPGLHSYRYGTSQWIDHGGGSSKCSSKCNSNCNCTKAAATTFLASRPFQHHGSLLLLFTLGRMLTTIGKLTVDRAQAAGRLPSSSTAQHSTAQHEWFRRRHDDDRIDHRTNTNAHHTPTAACGIHTTVDTNTPWILDTTRTAEPAERIRAYAHAYTQRRQALI